LTNSRGLFVVNGFQLGALSDTMLGTTTVTAAFVVSDVQVDFSFGLQRDQEGRNVVSCFDPQIFEIVEDGLVRCVYEGRGQFGSQIGCVTLLRFNVEADDEVADEKKVKL
jgi:hypothetical protein